MDPAPLSLSHSLLLNTSTPASTHIHAAAMRLLSNGPFARRRYEVIVRPGEEVSVPLVYVSYRAYDAVQAHRTRVPQYSADLDGGRVAGKAEEYAPVDISIKFVSVERNQVFGVLNLHVEPQPFAVDKRYHFWQPDSVALNSTVPLPASVTVTSVGARVAGVSVRTSSSHATLEIRPTKSHKHKEEVVVRLQRPVKGTTTFFAAFYTDVYCTSPSEIWELVVSGVDVVECTVPQGALKILALNTTGDHKSRRALLFSSAPSELYSTTADPVVVTAGAMCPVEACIGTTAVGKKQVLATVADVEDGTLIHTFLVVVTSIPSEPTREWQLTIDADRRVAKKLTHVNPYEETHTFTFATDRSDMLEIVPRTISIEHQAHVLLRFQPMSAGTVFRTKVFVTNEDGAVDAVYGLSVTVQPRRARDPAPAKVTKGPRATVWGPPSSPPPIGVDTLPMSAALETPD
jgi:hypothetical protein